MAGLKARLFKTTKMASFKNQGFCRTSLILRRYLRLLRERLGTFIGVRHQAQYPGKVLQRGVGIDRRAVVVLVVFAGVSNAGPTVRRLAEVVFSGPGHRS